MDTPERGILSNTAKPTDEEAGLSAVKEHDNLNSDNGSRRDSQDGKYTVSTEQRSIGSNDPHHRHNATTTIQRSLNP